MENWLDITTFLAYGTPVFFGMVILGILMATAFLALLNAVFAWDITEHKSIVITSIVAWALICVGAACIPTHDRILEVKIAKIKNEIVTGENVNKTIDEIGNILKKLEHKYLKK